MQIERSLLPHGTNTFNQDAPVVVQRENGFADDFYYNRANADERLQKEGTNNNNANDEAVAVESA